MTRFSALPCLVVVVVVVAVFNLKNTRTPSEHMKSEKVDKYDPTASNWLQTHRHV